MTQFVHRVFFRWVGRGEMGGDEEACAEQCVLKGKPYDVRIQQVQVKQAMNLLRMGKAPGIHGIHDWMVKLAGPKLVEALHVIFTAAWSLCYILAEWKKGI